MSNDLQLGVIAYTVAKHDATKANLLPEQMPTSIRVTCIQKIEGGKRKNVIQ